MRPLFVDREESLEELQELADAIVRDGRGGALSFDAPSGMGKSMLLAAFQESMARRRDARVPQVVMTRCQPTTGAGHRFGSIADLLVKLDERYRAANRLKRVLRASSRGALAVAPDLLLAAIAPGLQPVLRAGQEAFRVSLKGSTPQDSLWTHHHALATRIARAVLDIAHRLAGVVLIVDDIQYCDPSSLHVLDRLLDDIADAPVGLVLGFSTSRISGTTAGVDEVLRRWELYGPMRRIPLGGLPDQAVEHLVRHYYPDAPSSTGRALREITAGHPIFLSQFIQHWDLTAGLPPDPPANLTWLLSTQLDDLGDLERQLVTSGAVQGPVFDSATAAAVAGCDPGEADACLHQLAQRRHLITAVAAREEAPWDDADHYSFLHHSLWRVVYGTLSRQQRRDRHERTARTLAQRSAGTQPLQRRLEIAYHLRHGGPRCLADSSDADYALAREAAASLSLSEAEWFCRQAIASAQRLARDGGDGDQRLVQAALLLLSLTEVRWRGQHQEAGGPEPIDDIAATAEQAATRLAERAGDRAPLILATMMRGKTLMATRGLEPGLERLQRAVELAADHGDPVQLYVAKVEFGRQVSKRRLADGLRALWEAEQLRDADPRLTDDSDPVLAHARNLGELQLGITLFDSGRMTEATDRLEQAVGRLREQRNRTELPIAFNYLAQVHAGLGDHTAAVQGLREARQIEDDAAGDSGWHAYNTALLARVLAELDPADGEIRPLMEQAWAETERTWLLNLVPLVRNLYADVLVTIAPELADLEQAGRLATATIEETRRSGMVRSEIAAHCLLGRVRLRLGDAAGAVESVRRSVQLLDEVGPMPALRTEEILFHAAAVLAAAGHPDQAEPLLARARTEVASKADRIDDPVARAQFVDGVALNRAIRNGFGAIR